MQLSNIDWNWFFSSFSQCGAAIIGIIGGFVIYKIIDSNNSFDRINTEFDILVNKYHNLCKRIKIINLSEYYYSYFWSSPLVWSFIANDQLIGKDDNHLINFLYQHLSGLYKSDTIILTQMKIILSNIPSYKKSFDDTKNRIINEKIAKTMKENIDEQVIKSGDSISDFLINEKKLMSLKKKYKILRTLIFFMFFALLILVIYPLHFLPVNLNIKVFYTYDLKEILLNALSFSNILLFIFILFFVAFLSYFLKIIYKNNNMIKKLKPSYKKYIDIINYSEYFKAISVNPKYL